MQTQETTFKRAFGPTRYYVEEREWRIVYDDRMNKHFKRAPTGSSPAYYVPFEPGRELFTVVLPDNATVGLALSDNFIRKTLFPKDRPHVTILSLEDVNTF